MNASDFARALHQLDERLRKGVYSTAQLEEWLGDQLEDVAELPPLLEQAQSEGVVREIHPGIYWLLGSTVTKHDLLVPFIEAVRPGCLNYISFESMLSAAGVISQIPFILTVATTGESGRYVTEVGAVEFTTVPHSQEIEDMLNQYDFSLPYAPVAMAYQDCLRENRALDLIDEEMLQEYLDGTMD